MWPGRNISDRSLTIANKFLWKRAERSRALSPRGDLLLRPRVYPHVESLLLITAILYSNLNGDSRLRARAFASRFSIPRDCRPINFRFHASVDGRLERSC